MSDGGGISYGEFYFIETDIGPRIAWREMPKPEAICMAIKGMALGAALNRIHDARKHPLRFMPNLDLEPKP